MPVRKPFVRKEWVSVPVCRKGPIITRVVTRNVFLALKVKHQNVRIGAMEKMAVFAYPMVMPAVVMTVPVGLVRKDKRVNAPNTVDVLVSQRELRRSVMTLPVFLVQQDKHPSVPLMVMGKTAVSVYQVGRMPPVETVLVSPARVVRWQNVQLMANVPVCQRIQVLPVIITTVYPVKKEWQHAQVGEIALA